MTKKEQQRVLVLGQVDRGQLTVGQATEVLNLSERHVRRILAAYRKEGAAALAHGNRGRVPVHRIADAVRQQVAVLARTRYAGVNDQHRTELLAAREGIVLSRGTVRRIRQAAGVPSPRTRRAPRHRQRRARMPQAGMLVQWDGSHHAWLEDRGPQVVLLAAIDDATNEVLAAHFRLAEDRWGYRQLLQDLVTTYGCPMALYHDRHRIFRVNRPSTVAEELRGETGVTQLGRALAELGIGSIAARSPQAKGRIERLFGTLQDRLVVELRLADVTAANAVLTTFLPQFNTRFAVPATEPGSAFRPLDATTDLRGICCLKHERIVGRDNTVTVDAYRLQLLPGPRRVSYARATVEVQQRLDGSWVVCYQGRMLQSRPAPADAPQLRRFAGTRSPTVDDPLVEERREDLVVDGVDVWAGAAAAVHRSTPQPPAPNHPWRRYPNTTTTG